MNQSQISQRKKIVRKKSHIDLVPILLPPQIHTDFAAEIWLILSRIEAVMTQHFSLKRNCKRNYSCLRPSELLYERYDTPRFSIRASWLSLAIVFLAVFVAFGSPKSIDADEDGVRSFLANSDRTAYMQKGRHDLQLLKSVRKSRANSMVFQKTIDGIPLHGGLVTIVQDSNGRVINVIDNSSENLKLDFGRPEIGSAQAEQLVSTNLARSKALNSSSKLVWFRTGHNAQLAWRVTTELSDTGDSVSPTGLTTVLDVETGEVLSQSQTDSKTYDTDGPETVHGVYPRIVINDAIGASGSRSYASSFDSVVAFDFGCTGVLIADNVVLSARHCGARAGDQIIFGANSNNGTFTATVQSSILPAGNGSLLDGGDVAILILMSNVPANIARPMRLVDATDSLEGQVAATIGYGYNGVGSQGHNFAADGWRWGGENIIDRYGSPAVESGSNIFSTDFDNGSGSANTIPGSNSSPIQFEATTAAGDSGGPILVKVNNEWVIAGVLSGGSTNTSVYGDISWWTGTANFKTQIQAQGGEFVDWIILGDANGDGILNNLDIASFALALFNPVAYAVAFPEAEPDVVLDMNHDGVLNNLDIAAFSVALVQ